MSGVCRSFSLFHSLGNIAAASKHEYSQIIPKQPLIFTKFQENPYYNGSLGNAVVVWNSSRQVPESHYNWDH
jgi:hypothetical protein